MSDNNTAVRTKDLTKQFGKRVAVDRLNLEIQQGEVFALLGQNGAGKTTTIKMLCCLLKPTGGQAFVLEKDLSTQRQEIKQIINASPQETAIAPNLSVRENLHLIAAIYGFSRTQVRSRVSEMLSVFKLEDRAKDRAKKLSGGLQRRLSIAMALITDPELVFLDEPTLGLDPQSRRDLWEYIASLKGHKTIVLTTHYLEEAEALADRIGILRNGSIIAIGTTTDLKASFSKSASVCIKGTPLSQALLRSVRGLHPEASILNDSLDVRATTVDYYGLIRILESEGFVIESIHTNQSSLEDIYLSLSKEGQS